jgi:hypothetical protein
MVPASCPFRNDEARLKSRSVEADPWDLDAMFTDRIAIRTMPVRGIEARCGVR